MNNLSEKSGSRSGRHSEVVGQNSPDEPTPRPEPGQAGRPDASSPAVPPSKEISSGTLAYVPTAGRQPLIVDDQRSTTSGNEEVIPDASLNARTVISHRPVAAPEEFYRTMPLAELAAMLEGRQLDHFQVEQMIGGGGMGAVFRGRDLRLDRVVAIKVIPASKRDPETLRRFRLEAQAAARLDHPNIARVFYVGEAEQWNYIVFEFIDGVNIRDLLEIEGPLGVDDAVYYTRQVAEALEHARQRAVVHRDIKPSNILVTAAGHVKVVDMGLARDTSLDRSTADETASGITLGTFDYISPEQARNPRDADVRSDLYSLGCSLFFMLTGHPPFPEGTALQKLLNHGSQPPPDPRAWRDDLGDQLYEILLKLMAKRPADRYQKPLDLINDLVLFAELEELPRSQSPGTFMISPSVTQRTLIETNLPWMVAFAFLLGSTLWLQSVQSLSSENRLADFETESVASNLPSRPAAPEQSDLATEDQAAGAGSMSPAANSEEPLVGPQKPAFDPVIEPSATNPTLPDAPPPRLAATPQRGSTTDEVLVVCAEQPIDVAPMRWENSLSRAIERYVQDTTIREIEIRGRIILDRPVDFRSGLVQLRGSALQPAIIEFSPRLLTSVEDWAGLLNLHDTQLKCTSVALRLEVPSDVPIGKLGLFDLKGSSSVELHASTLTVIDVLRSESVHAFLVGGERRPATSSDGNGIAASARSANARWRAAVILRDSLVRGEASVVAFQNLQLASRLDISIDNTLVAVSGTTLDVKAPNGIDIPAGSVWFNCSRSTFLNEQGFATIEYVGEGSPLLDIRRTSQNCVFWSREGVPHVIIRGARIANVLGNFRLLQMQGQENAYDGNIRDMCHCFMGASKIATFGFTEANMNGWFAERGNASHVRWQATTIPALPLNKMELNDATVVTDGRFEMGVAAPRMPPL